MLAIQGDGRKTPGLPRKDRILCIKSVNSSFPGLSLVLSEIFEAIRIENHTSIHHNLVEAGNSMQKGYFSGIFSKGYLDCFPIFQSYINTIKILHPSPCLVIFWNSPIHLSQLLQNYLNNNYNYSTTLKDKIVNHQVSFSLTIMPPIHVALLGEAYEFRPKLTR